MEASVDRIADPWGGRTPYPRGRQWPAREGYGYPHLKSGLESHFVQGLLGQSALLLGLLPVVVGVFVGAPLFSGDLENGTAKLVSTQSVSRLRWLTTKLALTAAVVTVVTTAVSAAFTGGGHR